MANQAELLEATLRLQAEPGVARLGVSVRPAEAFLPPDSAFC